jgi:hypothetical protein
VTDITLGLASPGKTCDRNVTATDAFDDASHERGGAS